MDASTVLNIVQALTGTSECAALSSSFLNAVKAEGGMSQAMCYLRNDIGDTLLPFVSLGTPVANLPAISMAELDNPLLYSLHSGQVCLIEGMSGLLGVGEGYEALREALKGEEALLAVSLCDEQRQACGVLVFTGAVHVVRDWSNNATWTTLLEIYRQLFGALRARHGIAQGVRLARENQQLMQAEGSRQRATRLLTGEYVGSSAGARKTRRELLMIADSALAVLLTGETGAGKDHAAWLIHQVSTRGGHAFVPVNCAAIPKELIEAELFGCTRGAFTGATQARSGLVAAADGGTLFLDEIGDMPLALQTTLLRLLNEKKYRPVGATQERGSDFRLICATHQPLQQLVREGRFRQDLYFRICQLSLHLPALRERAEDLPALINHLITLHNREHRTRVLGMAEPAVARLRRHAFPGNVRELRSLILAASERTANGEPISLATVQALMSQPGYAGREPEHTAAPGWAPLQDLLHTENLPQAVDTFERLVIDERLRQASGSRSLAAVSLGIPKRTLARKCQKWNLEQSP
jgi:sigma-54-specific transcriptional regulator